jgi:glycine oxidase
MRYDVIVLGGGIIGCALAEELSRRDQRVAVLERGRIGAEASAAAAGILSAQMDVLAPGPFFDLCQASRRLYPSWIRRLEARSGERVDYEVRGVLHLAVSSAQVNRFERQARWQTKAGAPVERWTADEVRRREPAIDGPFRCAFHFPLEGQVDNVQLMRALTAACRRAGVRLREETAVRSLVVRASRVEAVETDRGRLRAPVIVNTLGSWAALRGTACARLPVEPARGQILSFAGPRGLFHRPVMTDRAYIIQRRDGQLLLGSTVERVGFDKRLTVQGMHHILRGARRISSALESCGFVEAWAGLRPYSRTGYPLLGRTSVEGLYVATGHFRHGILLAPITAQVMADLILRGRSSSDVALFSPQLSVEKYYHK